MQGVRARAGAREGLVKPEVIMLSRPDVRPECLMSVRNLLDEKKEDGENGD
jgi:hypothetical protein